MYICRFWLCVIVVFWSCCFKVIIIISLSVLYFCLFQYLSKSLSLVSFHDCHHLQLCSPAISGQKRNPLNLTCSSSQSTHAILDFHSPSGRLQLPNLDSLHNRDFFISHPFFFFVREQQDRKTMMKIIHTHNSLLWFPLQILPSDDSLGFVVLLFPSCELSLFGFFFVKLQRHGWCFQIVMYGISWIIEIDGSSPHGS